GVLMADTTLRLGDFVFAGMEIPDALPFGGSQRLAVHDFPGGARNVQAMGFNHAPVGWQGLFLGADALDRAKAVDAMRVKGAAVLLTCFSTSLKVVIERFEAKAERFYKVSYTISLVVVEDQSQAPTKAGPVGFDLAIRQDCTAMLAGGALLGDGPLSAALSTMDNAIGAVSNFATAATSTIQGVLGPVGAVIGRVDTLLAGVKNTLGSVTTLGGVLPGNPLAAQVSRMLGQVSASSQYPILQNIRNLGTRVSSNVINLQGAAQTLTVAGGNLYKVAADVYGDATLWPAIAKATGLRDPALAGVQTLQLPANPQTSGGVLSQ
ncbi:MAG: hypothetical protein JWQ72_2147, partial [Polaromonas sp.]|nr:hypothetical protein [Polaromonas sp.]